MMADEATRPAMPPFPSGGHGLRSMLPSPQKDDRAVVDAAVRRSGTSFYWAIRMLPEAKRQAMFAIYAFCREVDDIADEPGDIAIKRTRLAAWRQDIARLYEARAEPPQMAIARALAEPVQRFRLNRGDFQAVIAGMEMDAAARVRIADQGELALYCDRVACAVGRLSARVFGADNGTADSLAAALGEALQITNILRDLKEDAERDRLYLPADRLAAEGVADTDDAASVLTEPGTWAVCSELASQARSRFEAAGAILAQCDPQQMRPAIMMMEVYRRTLDRLMRRGWHRFAEPAGIPRLEKLWVAFRYGVL
ncbi:MAG: squalene synthase HpnD [Rhodospirillales bacterium]|nr:MAG: squalene synthase HpnD [Rhodospirillales bacterium]